MVEMLIIAGIVAGAGWYSYRKLKPTVTGSSACCEQGDDCGFKEFIKKEGNPDRLKCSGPQLERVIAEKRDSE